MRYMNNIDLGMKGFKEMVLQAWGTSSLDP